MPAPTSSVSYDTHVANTIAELMLGAFPSGLLAVVLTGSLARGEGTWLNGGARVRLAGDADFLGVFDDQAPLPPPDGIARLKQLAEERLASAGVDAHVGLSPVSARYLRLLPPDIYSYELITHGKVIWGDPHTLKLAPGFAASEIPIGDGFRLLMNRMIELLEIVCEHESLAAKDSTIRYRAMKLWLDMATSYLLFEGQYVATYRGRAARLCELSAQPSTVAPIPIRPFARMVALATRCKLAETADSAMSEFTDLAALIDAAHSLWRWELERLTLRSASDQDLRNQWLGDEPVTARMRGWAAVLARAGAARVVARMPAWIVLAQKGSPRRLVYNAASELLFAIPRILEDEPVSIDAYWDKLRGRLPVTDSPDKESSRCSWRRLGHAIAFNYNSFLVPTTS